MNKRRSYFVGGAALAGLFLAGSLMHSRESQAKGAYSSPVTVMNTTADSVPVTGAVSMAVPSQPFYAMATPNGSTVDTVIVGTGKLAITSITFTNLGSVTTEISFQSEQFPSQFLTCGGTPTGAAYPIMDLQVAAHQTVHLAFPSPLIFNPFNGQTCIGVYGGGGTTEVAFNGYLP